MASRNKYGQGGSSARYQMGLRLPKAAKGRSATIRKRVLSPASKGAALKGAQRAYFGQRTGRSERRYTVASKASGIAMRPSTAAGRLRQRRDRNGRFA